MCSVQQTSVLNLELDLNWEPLKECKQSAGVKHGPF